MQEIVYHTNYELEDNYFWFLARNKIVMKLIDNYFEIDKDTDFLDIGCGTGGFTKVIDSKFNAIGLDTSQIALDYSAKRGINNLYCSLLSDFPKDNWDVKAASMLDVIEHIEDDVSVVNEVFNLLPDNGYFIATVPAYKWLWSKHDEIHMHYRRYSRKNFNKLLSNAGFEIVYSTYFNSLLFPPAAAVRIIDKITGRDKKKSEPVDKVSPLMNKIFNIIFSFEAKLLPLLKFPFGLSIITVARKRSIKNHK